MKKRLVQTIANGGVNYGQVSHPLDLMKAQDFIHDRVSELTHDFLNSHKEHEVTGFDYELGGGNSFEITISAPGRVYAQDGSQFELLEDAELTIAAADAEFPRLDYVVAVLEENVDAELGLIPFVRLRTADEFTEGAPPYPHQNTNSALEKHNRVVVQVKTGEPAIVPTPPELLSNEVPLYLIAIAPNAAQINDSDILDIREIVLTLRKLNEITNLNTKGISRLLNRIEILETLIDQPIDLSQIFGQIRTLGDILTSLQSQLNAVRNLPDVRHDVPKAALTDPATSKIPAAGAMDPDTPNLPVVEIEIGGTVNFDGKDVTIEPDKFVDETRNARLVKIVDNPETETLETPLTLGSVTQIAADGFTDFTERASSFIASRARPAATARNDQFIEVFGGLASDNNTRLGDWMTYDVINDTLTPRVPTVALISSDRPALMSCGDNINVLLICGRSDIPTPQCFKINAVTGVPTEILTTKPTGIHFFGDLIAPNKIFIVATRKEIAGYETDYWEFDTVTNEFTQLGVTGSIPTITEYFVGGCYFGTNKFLLVSFTPMTASSGRTFLFDRTSLVWTEQNIAGPFGGDSDRQLPLSSFRLANVNGRPLLIGGLLQKDTDPNKARIWELQTRAHFLPSQQYSWKYWDATFPPVRDPGFCSTLVNGFPAGLAAMFAGQGKYSDAKSKIYSSVQGGLVATVYRGEPAITIADSSSFTQFTVPMHNNDWDVASYLLNLVGKFDENTLKVEVSFDADETYHLMTPGKMLLISDSDSPGIRSMRFTMFNLKSSKPVLSRMIEVFDEDGVELETRMIIRYDAVPIVTAALYVNRDGTITLSEDILPSTPDRCLLHKADWQGPAIAPVVKNYINRRRPHIKYTGTYDGSPETLEFDNELAVPVRYVDARAVVAAGSHLYKIGDPDVEFDSIVEVTGVTNGDDWIVELEG